VSSILRVASAAGAWAVQSELINPPPRQTIAKKACLRQSGLLSAVTLSMSDFLFLRPRQWSFQDANHPGFLVASRIQPYVRFDMPICFPEKRDFPKFKVTGSGSPP
jgi:hypothetical protein